MRINNTTLRIVAVFGNLLFVFWILVNGINEGFDGTRVEVVSYLTLLVLLLLNAYLLYPKNKP
jgi:hypothetical protein